MSLRRLQYFVTLADELHFGRAAQKLHLAQPALSHNLRVLEEDLGVALMVRSSRRVELTEAGRVLRRDAAKLLEHAASLESEMRALASGTVGTLRLNYARSAPGGRSSEFVDAFRRARPAVRLDINSQVTARSVEELVAGRIDAAFVRTPLEADELGSHAGRGPAPAGLELLTVDSEALVVGLPEAHALARRDRLSRHDVRQEPLVTGRPERAPGFYQSMFRQIWGRALPNIVMEEPDEEHMLRAVAAGLGLTILTCSRAETLHVSGVVFRRFKKPEPTATLALAWRTANTSPALAAFIAIVRDGEQ